MNEFRSSDYCVARYLDEDESGRFVVFDEECDGVAEWCETSTYDSEGRIIASEGDDDCDGTLDHCATYVIDGSSTLAQDDAGCSGTPTECEVFHFEDGRIDCDGVPDEECLSERYVDGELVASYLDTDCDGSGDRDCQTRESADDGYLSKFDEDCVGVTDYCQRNETDSNGNVIASARDDLCDGTPDATCRTRTDDARGKPLTLQEDADCSGGPDGVCWEWAYDSEGRETSLVRDDDCDEVVDDCTFTTHD